MKWSKEREKAFEKVINHIIEVIEDKSKSEDLPEWVVDQVQKRLNKINFYYDGKEVSWNEIPLDVRKHDYPYYFKDDLDCYPLKIKL